MPNELAKQLSLSSLAKPKRDSKKSKKTKKEAVRGEGKKRKPKRMTIENGDSGGHIVKHDHADGTSEQHAIPDMKSLLSHVENHMGEDAAAAPPEPPPGMMA